MTLDTPRQSHEQISPASADHAGRDRKSIDGAAINAIDGAAINAINSIQAIQAIQAINAINSIQAIQAIRDTAINAGSPQSA